MHFQILDSLWLQGLVNPSVGAIAITWNYYLPGKKYFTIILPLDVNPILFFVFL